MKLIIFGATGDVGRRLIAEALSRGHSVTAVARSTTPLEGSPEDIERVDADILAAPDRVSTLIAGHDAVVSALRPPEGHEHKLVDLTRTVVEGERLATCRCS